MKKLYVVFVTLSLLFSATKVFSQAASITWPLTSTINPDAPVGNIQGTPESIGSDPHLSCQFFLLTAMDSDFGLQTDGPQVT